MKHSDNLTDLVAHLDEHKDQAEKDPANKGWEVKNDDNETIKLDDRLKEQNSHRLQG